MNIDKAQLMRLGRKGLKVAGEVASVAVQLRTDSGPLGIASVVAKVASTMLEQSESEPFAGWSAVGGVSQLGDFCLGLAKRGGLLSEIPMQRKGSRALAGSINGVRIGWSMYDRWIDGPYLAPGHGDGDAESALRALIWAGVGKAIRYVPADPSKPFSQPSIQADGLDETRASQTAVELWGMVDKFLAAGERQSLLLVGEPNTGKSNIVRHIAEQAGGYTLRLGAREVGDAKSIGALCYFLRPDALIIDDLDRAQEPGAVLDKLDEMLRHCRLVLVTVNRMETPDNSNAPIKGLDPAVVRRFDHVKTIDKLDDEVLNSLLAGVPSEAADRLRNLPIGYIDKFRKHVRVLGMDQAVAKIGELETQRDLVLRLQGSAQTQASTATEASKPS
jgi:hypothetical protein